MEFAPNERSSAPCLSGRRGSGRLAEWSSWCVAAYLSPQNFFDRPLVPYFIQHYHNGSRDDPEGVAFRKKAETEVHENRLSPAMASHDDRAPDRWNSSVKVRHHEAVHLPEYKVRTVSLCIAFSAPTSSAPPALSRIRQGWHNKDPTKNNAAWTWVPKPGNGLPVKPVTRVSRGPNFRVSENAGFSWDPAASYGPETVKALPKVDDKVREALFDESADQRFDGQPGTGFMHFGKATHT